MEHDIIREAVTIKRDTNTEASTQRRNTQASEQGKKWAMKKAQARRGNSHR
jgi:hypothetical protein